MPVLGDHSALHADAVRLDLTQPLRPDHLQALDAVGVAALEQVLEPRQLALGGWRR